MRIPDSLFIISPSLVSYWRLFVIAFVLLTVSTSCTDRNTENNVSEVVRTARADHEQAVEYDGQWQMRLAEMHYRKAYEALQENPSQDWFTYGDAGYRYAFLTYDRGDVEGALDIVTKIMDRIEKNPKTEPEVPSGVVAALLSLMAECQMQLSMTDEAKQTYARFYDEEKKTLGGERQGEIGMVFACYQISHSFLKMGEYDEAEQWMHRSEEELEAWEEKTIKDKDENKHWRGDSLLLEEYRCHRALCRTLLLQATGHPQEAADTYDAIPRSRIFNPLTITSAARYLMSAGRYSEAANMYARLDTTYAAADSSRMTFDKISECLAPRYLANRKAGVTAEALATADKMSAAIDSALVWQKRSDAAELAVIYQAHQKDLQLTKLLFTISLHQVILIAASIIILLIGFLLWRTYRYNKELKVKNKRFVAEIEQREQEKKQAIEQLKTQPKESLTTQQQLFSRICDIMDSPEHIYTDTGLDRLRLAQLLGTNEHYVSDAISACTGGKNVTGFLNDYRLRYATHLLVTTKDSVSLIAELSGFARSSFFRIFNDAYGMSPSEYRRIAGK